MVRRWKSFVRVPAWARRGFLVCCPIAALCGPAAPAGAVEAPFRGGGPEIGWVISFLAVGGPDGRLYAGTYGGGVFERQVGGQNWVDATSNARDTVVWRMHAADDGLATLYAAAEDRGLLRTQGGSEFWTTLGGQPTSVELAGLSLSTFPGRENRIAFGTQNGVFVSNDRGNSWPDTLAYLPGNTVFELVVPASRPNTIYALTPTEVVVTANVGQSITSLTDGLPPTAYMTSMTPLDAGGDSLLIADFRGEVHLLTGDRFTAVGPSLSPLRVYTVAVDPTDASIWAGSDRGLHRTAGVASPWAFDDGQLGRSLPEVWAVLPDGTGGAWLGTFSSGVARVDSFGTAWQLSNRGLTAAWIGSVESWGDEILAGTAHGRVFHSSDRGTSWVDVTGGLQMRQMTVAHRTASLDRWLIGGTEGVAVSDDRGATWQPVGLPGGASRLLRLRALGVAGDTELLATSDRGLLVSGDGGLSWTQRTDVPTDRLGFALTTHPTGLVACGFDPLPGRTDPLLVVGPVDSVLVPIALPASFRGRPRALAFLDARTLLVAAEPSTGFALYRIDHWDDPLQRSFTELESALPVSLPSPRHMAKVGDTILLGLAERGVLRSDDAGGTWRAWSEGLASERIEALDVLEGTPHQVTVGTLARGVFTRDLAISVPVLVSGLRARGDDGRVMVEFSVSGATALRVRREQPSPAVLFEGRATPERQVEVVDRLAGVDAPRTRRAVWVVESLEGGAVQVIGTLTRDLRDLLPARRTRLLPATPNPFNPRTSVRWEQSESARVRIDVYDARGRLVRRLLDRELGAGEHRIPFDGTDDRGASVASGTYLLRMTVGDRAWTGRVTLVR